MKTVTHILPGVKLIGWVDCSKLPKGTALAGICRMPVTILTDVHNIDFFDDPECTCKTTRNNGANEDKTSLKFHSSVELPNISSLGFVITDVNDNSFLIGSKERPVKIVQPESNLGTAAGSAAGLYYEISHVDVKSLVPCIANVYN